jgi:hypothetical protein
MTDEAENNAVPVPTPVTFHGDTVNWNPSSFPSGFTSFSHSLRELVEREQANAAIEHVEFEHRPVTGPSPFPWVVVDLNETDQYGHSMYEVQGADGQDLLDTASNTRDKINADIIVAAGEMFDLLSRYTSGLDADGRFSADTILSMSTNDIMALRLKMIALVSRLNGVLPETPEEPVPVTKPLTGNRILDLD